MVTVLTEKFVSPHQGLVPSDTTRRALVATFHGLALITTSIRLLQRLKVRRLWWDDFWAFIALVNAILVCIIFFLRPYFTVSKSISFQIFGDIGNVMFYVFGLWCAKVSMAVTLVRLLPPGKFNTIAKSVAMLFGILGVILSIHRVFGCNITKPSRRPCIIKPSIGYIEIVFDLTSDMWLVAAPLYMIWQLRLRLPAQRFRLFSVAFACGLFTTVASVVHDVYVFRSAPVLMGLTAHVQLGVSIVVCNLLVLLTSFYRKFRNNGDTTERHDSTVPTDYSRGRLATVSTPQAPSDVHISPNSPSATDIISFTELGSSMMHSLSSSYNPSSYTSNISKG
ncbi:hypothetical protein BJ165DRAFT_1470431 [Panaeolus papilionaceus]|nr:hypothetical protein BJ165DRAFT_1470431 [Panaeolus papilionaceus]